MVNRRAGWLWAELVCSSLRGWGTHALRHTVHLSHVWFSRAACCGIASLRRAAGSTTPAASLRQPCRPVRVVAATTSLTPDQRPAAHAAGGSAIPSAPRITRAQWPRWSTGVRAGCGRSWHDPLSGLGAPNGSRDGAACGGFPHVVHGAISRDHAGGFDGQAAGGAGMYRSRVTGSHRMPGGLRRRGAGVAPGTCRCRRGLEAADPNGVKPGFTTLLPHEPRGSLRCPGRSDLQRGLGGLV